MTSNRDRFEVDPAPDASPHPPARFALPPGAVDTHAHVIGTEYIESRSYTPHPAPVEAYVRMLDATGMAHGVLVQVSVHGTDNTLMLDALRAHRARLRGIAVAPHDLPAAQWQALKEAGVVGLRLNTTTGGGVGVSALADYEAVCAEMGWHLQFLVEPERIAQLAPQVARLRVPVVFDHMGYVTPGHATAEAGRTLLALVRDGAWVKLSGAFRLSRTGPPYADMRDYTAALAQAGPTRCVWGSDWPHVSFRGRMPNTGDLLDVLAEAVPEAHRLHAILAANPQRLYGFPATGAA
jgi:2-pyrone-4,6-dicarboxylate lactonase